MLATLRSWSSRGRAWFLDCHGSLPSRSLFVGTSSIPAETADWPQSAPGTRRRSCQWRSSFRRSSSRSRGGWPDVVAALDHPGVNREYVENWPVR